MVTKKVRTISAILTLTMGLTMVTGCGKKKDSAKAEDMIEKYAAFCELGEYKGIEYKKTVYEITDDDVQSQVNSLLSQYATSEEVAEGDDKVAEEGDVVNIDFVGTVDGEEFQGGNSNGNGYDVTLGQGAMIPGFEDGIIGHKLNETFDINVTFPDDYQDADNITEGQTLLNGRDAVFSITINSLTKTINPEYNDAFVASNTDYQTVSEYESELRKQLELTAADRAKSVDRSTVITAVQNNANITEYPEKELEELIDDAIDSVSTTAASYGYSLSSYVTSVYGMSSEDEFREYVSSLAVSYLKEKILVCAIAKAEGITIDEDDKKAQKELMMEELGIDDEDEFDGYYTNEDVIYYTISEKVYDFLLENAVSVDDTDTEEDSSSDASASDAK